MKPVAAIIAMVASLAAQAAQAREPLVLRPATPWTMNYAEDSCQLVRSFGEGEDETALLLEQFAPATRVQMTMIGKYARMRNSVGPAFAIDRRFPGPLTLPAAQIRFGKSAEFSLFTFKSAELNDGRHLTIFHDVRPVVAVQNGPERQDNEWHLPALSVAALEGSDRIEIADPISRDLILASGPLGSAAEAMNRCMGELLAHWGVDAEAHQTLHSPATPRTDVNEWLTSRDFPDFAEASSREGVVHFRLSIDDTGKPTQRHVQLATGADKSFRNDLCNSVMRQADFDPAIAADGQPIASYFAIALNYVLR